MSTIADNLERIRSELTEAAIAAGREPASVQLLAVSKTKPATMVAEAMAAGQLHFGENTIQDAQTKIPVLADHNPVWHFIGHLQSNKAKFIPGQFQWLHTLHSLELAHKLSNRLEDANENLNTLIQVNITHDERKHGLLPDAVDAFMDQLLASKSAGLQLRGLMTIGLQSEDATELRKGFSDLRELRDQLASRYDLPQFDQLSMGMSADYHEAIAEGATWVRIGSAIFGSR
jgi:pyridoxal phosphate enzyme (YggS family)